MSTEPPEIVAQSPQLVPPLSLPHSSPTITIQNPPYIVADSTRAVEGPATTWEATPRYSPRRLPSLSGRSHLPPCLMQEPTLNSYHSTPRLQLPSVFRAQSSTPLSFTSDIVVDKSPNGPLSKPTAFMSTGSDSASHASDTASESSLYRRQQLLKPSSFTHRTRVPGSVNPKSIVTWPQNASARVGPTRSRRSRHKKCPSLEAAAMNALLGYQLEYSSSSLGSPGFRGLSPHGRSPGRSRPPSPPSLSLPPTAELSSGPPSGALPNVGADDILADLDLTMAAAKLLKAIFSHDKATVDQLLVEVPELITNFPFIQVSFFPLLFRLLAKQRLAAHAGWSNAHARRSDEQQSKAGCGSQANGSRPVSARCGKQSSIIC